MIVYVHCSCHLIYNDVILYSIEMFLQNLHLMSNLRRTVISLALIYLGDGTACVYGALSMVFD